MQEAYNAAKRIRFIESANDPATGQVVYVTSEPVNDFLQSPDGAVQLAHLSLSKHHNLTLDQTADLLSDFDVLQTVVERIMQISGMGGDTSASSAEGSGGDSAAGSKSEVPGQ
jgi:hypothetical protein